ncbi:diguanylate cyclase/phosphodiesterase (GGDEF & EAL domains) with PAS/PAC sensor(s) [Pseudoalteromonas sp. JB197]|nr:diguanylate cyclase/phosphodiesterase (GGDEF & EAL domains) with PAS/PAC sensor(s) [Pseudoalteromonas sp. JB197]
MPIGGKEKHLVVFDSQGQLLAHPTLTQSSYAQYGKAGKKLLPEDFIDPTLQVIVDDAIKMQLPEYASSFKLNDEAHIINIHKVDGLD